MLVVEKGAVCQRRGATPQGVNCCWGMVSNIGEWAAGTMVLLGEAVTKEYGGRLISITDTSCHFVLVNLVFGPHFSQSGN